MKKIILLILSVFCILSLSSCRGDDKIDETGLHTEIALEWFNNVNFETEAYNDYKTDGIHYRAYLPVDIDETSLRLNKLDVTDYLTDKYDFFTVNYASNLDLSNYQGAFLSDLQANIEGKLSFLEETNLTFNWSTKLIIEQPYKGYTGSDKVTLYTVYLPIKFEVYKNETARTLATYIICPVVYGLSFENNGELLANTSVNALQEVAFVTSNGYLR